MLPKIKFDAQLPNFGNPKKERHSSTPQKKCPTAIFFFAKKHNKKSKKGDNHSHYLIIFLLTHPDAPDSLRAIHPVASKKNPKKEFPLLCPSSTVFREGLFPLHKKIFKLFHVNPVQGFLLIFSNCDSGVSASAGSRDTTHTANHKWNGCYNTKNVKVPIIFSLIF